MLANTGIFIDLKKTDILKKFVQQCKDIYEFDGYMKELDYLRKIDKERNDVIKVRWVDNCAIKLFKREIDRLTGKDVKRQINIKM
jgi:hypothetical protein